ncbi:beta-lactamase/transpeptidase-like protein [Aspergillus californicus]
MSTSNSCAPGNPVALAQRFRDAVSEIHRIKDIFQTPSISFGVVHQGQVVLRESIGYRDVEKGLDANPDTIYPISSCTKMFTSAAMGLLVDEGKVQWDDRVSKHVPEFNPRGDPRIASEADIIDLLRHSMGYADPSYLCVGPRACHLIDSKTLIQLLNMMPTANAEGQRFNRCWMYSNSNFSLAGAIITRVAGQEFTEFIRSRILRPLQMNRTILTKADIQDDNVVSQYTRLPNGTLKKLATDHWPFDTNTAGLPGAGIGSSLNDMLTWCISVLSAEREESANGFTTTAPRPLKQMNRVRRGYWTRPSDDPNAGGEVAFGMGWIRMTHPTSMLGAYSGNGCSREAPWKLHQSNILGTHSKKRVMVGHTGGSTGALATIWTFPETQSAVCTMVNMRELGDASDFAAQILIQALFDLEPRVDLVPWAMKEAELNRSRPTNELLRPWMANRREEDHERDRIIYVGEYKGFGDLFTLAISAGQDTRLVVTFNYRERTRSELVFFKKDTYSLFTGDLDYWLAEWFPYRDYCQTLLEFEVSNSGMVLGLWWMWNIDEERAWLQRVD